MDTAPGSTRSMLGQVGPAKDSYCCAAQAPPRKPEPPVHQPLKTTGQQTLRALGATARCGSATDTIHCVFQCGDYHPSKGKETEA